MCDVMFHHIAHQSHWTIFVGVAPSSAADTQLSPSVKLLNLALFNLYPLPNQGTVVPLAPASNQQREQRDRPQSARDALTRRHHGGNH